MMSFFVDDRVMEFEKVEDLTTGGETCFRVYQLPILESFSEKCSAFELRVIKSPNEYCQQWLEALRTLENGEYLVNIFEAKLIPNSVWICDYAIYGHKALSKVWIKVVIESRDFFINVRPISDSGSLQKLNPADRFMDLLGGFTPHISPGCSMFASVGESWPSQDEMRCFSNSENELEWSVVKKDAAIDFHYDHVLRLVLFNKKEIRWYVMLDGEFVFYDGWHSVSEFTKWYSTVVLTDTMWGQWENKMRKERSLHS